MERFVFGVGINDAQYIVQPTVNGERYYCPIYQCWQDMLRRCYDSNSSHKYPTYSNCKVCDEWLIFSNFKEWYQTNPPKEGYELDKDLLFPGNKEYSPKTCIFVPSKINNFILDRKRKRGLYPIGVCFHKRSKKYQATIKLDNKQHYLGLFSTPETAYEAWKKSKLQFLDNMKSELDEIDVRLFDSIKLIIENQE